MLRETSPVFVAYYTLAALSFCCSGFVVLSLVRFASLRTTITRLILYLHLTIMAEEITALPFIYKPVPWLCKAVQFFHFYFGLANILIVGMLVLSYRYLFFEDTLNITEKIKEYGMPYFVLSFPLIALLPFTTASYRESTQNWCTMPIDHIQSNIWGFCIFYGWVWAILMFATITLTYTTYCVLSIDKEMGKKLLYSIGSYAIISILAWVPRTATRIAHFDADFSQETVPLIGSYIPIYISGLLYAVLFFTEKKSLKLFESFNVGTESSIDDDDGVFSWEEFDETLSISEQRRTTFQGPRQNAGVALGKNQQRHSSSDVRSPQVVELVASHTTGNRTTSSSTDRNTFSGTSNPLNTMLQ